jgi:hypothetical protein
MGSPRILVLSFPILGFFLSPILFFSHLFFFIFFHLIFKHCIVLSLLQPSLIVELLVGTESYNHSFCSDQ